MNLPENVACVEGEELVIREARRPRSGAPRGILCLKFYDKEHLITVEGDLKGMKLNSLWRWISCFWLVLFLLSSLKVQAGILDAWHWRNPVPFADTMQSICFGGGKFVAVGSGGIVHTSADGVTWDDGRRPVLLTLNRVIYANGQFVAIGNSGTIITSSNAADWTLQNSGVTNDLLAVAFGNGRFVACGMAGQLTISTDGVTWTPGTIGSGDLGWIAFGNGLFMIPGSGTNVRVSPDGQTWADASLPVAGNNYNHSLHQVDFGNGTFVAAVSDEQPGNGYSLPASHFYRSNDGTNWAQGAFLDFGPGAYANDGFVHRFLVFLNGKFHELTYLNSGSLPGPVISLSIDGTSSTVTYAPSNAPLAQSMAYGNGKYVLVEESGKGWVSTDETNWTATYGGFQGNFSQILQGTSNFVVFGSSLPVLVSSDGLSFNIASNSPSGVLVAGAFDGTNYVGVGATVQSVHPGGITYNGEVYTSTNSTDWVQRTSNVNQPLNAICRGPSRWVAVGGGGAVITSPNTLAWTLRASGTGNNLNGVTFGNGTYVAVGDGGTVITSADGATWDVQFSGTTANLSGLQFLNGQFFAVGVGGTILTSTDGIDWSSQNSGTPTGLNSITYGYGGYVASGFDFDIYGQPINSVFLSSSNGVDWQDIALKIPTVTPARWTAYLNHSFWLVGYSGMILQSDSADGVPRLAGSMLPGNTGFQLNTTINPPATYRVQFRTNILLDSWHDIVTQTNLISSDTWTDTNNCRLPAGFYRVVSP